MKLSAHQVKVARRVYEMFKLWPGAISHLKNLTIRDIAQMSNEQSQALTLRLIMEMPNGNQQTSIDRILIVA